jgi:hypothetical protein
VDRAGSRSPVSHDGTAAFSYSRKPRGGLVRLKAQGLVVVRNRGDPTPGKAAIDPDCLVGVLDHKIGLPRDLPRSGPIGKDDRIGGIEPDRFVVAFDRAIDLALALAGKALLRCSRRWRDRNFAGSDEHYLGY